MTNTRRSGGLSRMSTAIFEHRLIVRQFFLSVGLRLTRQLAADVESLLIRRIKPLVNIQCIKTRDVCRPAMVVCCQGE